MNNPELEEKALDYISTGYQKLLTYEVQGTEGGYSLYGDSPAEPVITAFGLMEMKELSEVYQIDENVIEEIKRQLKDGEIVKIRFSRNIASNKDEFLEEIVAKTRSKLIDVRGNVAVLYKRK